MSKSFVDWRLDKNTNTPFYRQIYENLKRKIKSGELQPRFSLPSEKDIATSLEITVPTLRQAFERLEKEGFILRKQGIGTFVAEPATWERDKNTLTLGIIAWRCDFPNYMKDIFALICSEAISAGIELKTVHCTDFDLDLQKRVLHESLDGVIALPTGSRRQLEQLRPIKVPKVILEIRTEQEGLDHVVIDSLPGVYTGVNELIKLGHREIGYVGALYRDLDSGFYKLTPDAEVRFSAYRKALEDAGIEYRSEFYADLPYEELLADEWILKRKQENRLPTAIVAFDDGIAQILKQACEKHGLNVPADLSIMGFAGFAPEGEMATVVFDHKTMARLAVQRIQERIQNGGMSGLFINVKTRFRMGRSFSTPRKTVTTL